MLSEGTYRPLTRNLDGRLTSVISQSRSHAQLFDSAGNRLSETVAGNTIHYGYDGLNRLVRRQQPSMSIWPSHRAAAVTLSAGTWGYTHDGRGLRTSKAQLNAQGSPITSTRVRYVYGPSSSATARFIMSTATIWDALRW